MSRTKTETVDVESAGNETVSENIELSESVENSVETITETVAESETVISEKNNSEMPVKISVIQYLENKPQSVYVAELMKRNYGMEFHSENEWDLLLQKLVGKKI